MPHHHPSPSLLSPEEGSGEVALLVAVVARLAKDVHSRHVGIQAEARLFVQEGSGLGFLGDLLGIDTARLTAYVLRARCGG
jgi:hypothetical protein